MAAAGCGGSASGAVASTASVPVHASPASATLATWLEQVNALCSEYDRAKTAIYTAGLSDGRLTLAEFVDAERLLPPLAAAFDRKVTAVQPLDARLAPVFNAYRTWVDERRTALADAADTGDDAVFSKALEQSNVGFFESAEVSAMKAGRFVLACLSR